MGGWLDFQLIRKWADEKEEGDPSSQALDLPQLAPPTSGESISDAETFRHCGLHFLLFPLPKGPSTQPTGSGEEAH